MSLALKEVLTALAYQRVVMPYRFSNPPRPLASIAFGVKDPRPVGGLLKGSRNLWSARVKVVRPGLFCRVFSNIFFAESHNTAYIFGIEMQDGRPADLPDDLAYLQQQFIHFLREQTRIDSVALGWMVEAFEGYEYGCEGAATAAYVVARDIPLHLGIGYQAASGAYELVGLHWTDELVAYARTTLPFDELDEV